MKADVLKKNIIVITTIVCFLSIFHYKRDFGTRNAVKRNFNLSAKGMLGLYYKNTDSAGEAVYITIDNHIDDSCFNKRTGANSFFSAKWQGVFYSDKKTKIKFFLNSDDGSSLYIDNILVIDNDGAHPETIVKKTATINRGWHSVEIKYNQYAGLYKMEFSWQGLKNKMDRGDRFDGFHPPYSEQSFKEFCEYKEGLKKWSYADVFLLLLALSIIIYTLFKEKIYHFMGRLKTAVKETLSFKQPLPLLGQHSRRMYWLFAFTILIIAFINRLTYYFNHPYIYCNNIGTGSDFAAYFSGAIEFAKTFKPSFFSVGSAGLIVPFMGMLFRLFDIYPGIFYFCMIEMALSSLVCIIPFIISKTSFGIISAGGILSGLWLAYDPLIINITPQSGTDTLGLFVLSMAILFLYRVLYNKKISDYIFFGIFGFLMFITRHVLIPIGILMILVYACANIKYLCKKLKIEKNKIKKRIIGRDIIIMLLPLAIIAGLIFCYDYLYIYRNGGDSLILYNVTSGAPFLKGDTDIKQDDFYTALSSIIKKKYDNIHKVNNSFTENVLCKKVLLKKSVVIMLGLYAALVIVSKGAFKYFIILLMGGAYYVLLCLTYINPRYLLPLIFVLSIIISFLIDFFTSVVFFMRGKYLGRVNKIFTYSLSFIIFIGFCFSVKLFYSSITNYNIYINYLKLVGREAHENSIILTEANANPWLINKYTGKKVAHNAIYGGSIFVDEVPWRLEDYKITSAMFNDKGIKGIGNVMNFFTERGVRLLLLDTRFVNDLRDYYLKEQDSYELRGCYNSKIKLYKSFAIKGAYKSIHTLEASDF